jgi:hypothetical protein
MAWVETESLSFVARHESEDTDAAVAILDELERFRARLESFFDTTPDEVSVVIHSHAFALTMAHPWLPVARLLTAPAGRRYMAGWFGEGEIHVLAPSLLAERASRVEGSREALMLAPLHEYAHLVVGANNDELPPPFTTRTFRRYTRWAWLCEGAATHFSGQDQHLSPAIRARLREGGRPSFPPDVRDATLLGGTLYRLLAEDRGERACAELASTLDPVGPASAIARAFGRPAVEVERDWRAEIEAY